MSWRSLRRAWTCSRALAAGAGALIVAAAAAATPTLPAALPSSERARLAPIADRADVSTEVAAEPFLTRRPVFEFLLDHPDFASHVTGALKLARYKITRTGDGFYLDEGWGVYGNFWVVYAGEGTRVMLARGEYRNAVLPTIYGDAVTIIAYDATPAADGRSVVHTTVSGFLKLDSRVLARLMQLASNVAQRKADREARKLMKVFAEASQAIEKDPAGVVARLRQRPGVPGRELEEFARLVSAR